MARTILSSLRSKAGVKIDNITTGQNIFFDLTTIEARVSLSARLHKHKTDAGNTICDGRTREPFAIHLNGIFSDYRKLKKARAILQGRGEYYRVTINGIVWENCLCAICEIDQSAEMVSSSPFNIIFAQAIVRKFGYTKTEQGADSPNRKFGDVVPEGITTTIGQIFDIILNKI